MMFYRFIQILSLLGMLVFFAGTSCETCPPINEPVATAHFYIDDEQINPSFTDVYGIEDGNRRTSISKTSGYSYKLPLTLQEDKSTFVFEESGKSYELEINYKRMVDYHNKNCGYVIFITEIVGHSNDFDSIAVEDYNVVEHPWSFYPSPKERVIRIKVYF